MADNLLVQLWKRIFPSPKKVGILTLAPNDNTPAFRAFYQGMTDNNYRRGRDYTPVFVSAVNDAGFSVAANSLLSNSVDVVLADGSKALQEVYNQDFTMKIVQAVGGEVPPNLPNITGFHLNVHKMCMDQLDDLLNLKPCPATVTVLVYDTGHPIIGELRTHAAGRTIINPLPASLPSDLTAAKFSAVVDSFMVIPNGMYFNNHPTIANLMDGKNVPKNYPEREYYDAHGNKRRVGVRGHLILDAFHDSAADIVRFLSTGGKQPAREAPTIYIPI